MDSELLDAASPMAVIASSARFPEKASLPRETVELLKTRGIPLLRQDVKGAVTVSFFRTHADLAGFVDESLIRLKHRR